MQSAPGSGGDDEEEGQIFSEINITPLTDVFLVLLIIFMLVASSMVDVERSNSAVKALAEKAMQVETPKGSGDSEVVKKDIVVSILADGTLFVDDTQVIMEVLPAKFIELKQNAVSSRVVIRGDQRAAYDLIMQVISAARSVGITDVALASRSK